MELSGQRHAPASLTAGKRPGTDCVGGLSGPQVLSGRVRKIFPLQGFDPLTVQPVASRSTGPQVFK
jgi:hypothetical protein